MTPSAVAAAARRALVGLLRIRELPVLLLIAGVGAWLAVTSSAFRAPQNLAQVGQEAAIVGIMACGQAFVILTGGIDLSVAAVLAMSACVMGERMMAGWPWPAAVALGLATGAAAGYASGALITWRRLPPILTTLAGLLLFRAATYVLTGAVPYNQLPGAFKRFADGFTPFALFVLISAGFWVAQTRTRSGRRIVAIGGAESAARLSGVPVDSALRGVYLASGLCAAAAGSIMAAGANNAQWNLAEGWELEVIAAVVIGGVRLTGGEGSVAGAALGAIIIVLMRNALFLHGVPMERYGLIVGAVILIAALAEQARRARAVD